MVDNRISVDVEQRILLRRVQGPLEDDKSLFAAENVVPVIKSAKQTDTITTTLDSVSAKLTTDDLISMNAEAAKGTNLADIATKWLADAGLSTK